MPRIPKNNQPQQAPVQSQQGGNVRAGTAQPTASPQPAADTMQKQLEQQAVANTPTQQSVSGGSAKAGVASPTSAQPAGVSSPAVSSGVDQRPSYQQGISPASSQSRSPATAEAALQEALSTIQGTAPDNDRQETAIIQGELSHQQQSQTPTVSPGEQRAEDQAPQAPAKKPRAPAQLIPEATDQTDSGTGTPMGKQPGASGDQSEGQQPTGAGGSGAGGEGGGGTTPGSEIDTGATPENPYDQTITDYQTQAQQIIDTLSTMTQEQLAAYAEKTGQTIDEAKKQIESILAQLQASMPEGQAGRVDHVSTEEQEQMLQQIMEAAQQQAEGRIDYGVQQAVDQLTRAQEDAQSQFQTMRDQIAANEAQALDNQALYAEARGDRGGIGQAQYGSIQNTAATNQLTVNREQTKLATDTARQIADLRAQGEFQKADQLLSLTQSYLSKLMELKQWADSTNIGIDEFNIGVEKWEQEFQQQVAQIMGGMQLDALQWTTGLDLSQQQTMLQEQLAAAQQQAGMGLDVAGTVAGMQMTATQQMQQQAAQAAQQMISAGITPTDAQLSALGWTREQYDAYRAAMQAAQSGGGGSSDDFPQLIRDLIETGGTVASIQAAIAQAQASGNHDAAIIQEAQQILSTAVDQYGYTGTVD